MITTVRFDVHGLDALEIQDRATEELARFSVGALSSDAWTVHIDVHEEAQRSDGVIASWRGEVTAIRHDPVR